MGVGVRGASVRGLAALFAAGWLTVGFGVVDLVAAWWPDWPRVLEAGWGAFVSFLISVPLLVLVVRPRSAAAYAQLLLVVGVLAFSSAAALEAQLLGLDGVLAGQLVLLAALARPSVRVETAASPRLLALAAAGAVPWLVYAHRMWDANRDGLSGDLTNGVEHYAMQGALGLALALFPAVAAVAPALRLLLLPCAGAAAIYLAVVSLAAPGELGGFGAAW